MNSEDSKREIRRELDVALQSEYTVKV